LIIIDSFMAGTLGPRRAAPTSRPRCAAGGAGIVRPVDDAVDDAVHGAVSDAVHGAADVAADLDRSSRLLRVHGVAKRFGDHQVLDGIELEVSPGSICALLGPSGSGKTTLLRLIAGLDAPDEGTIRLGGDVLSGAGTFVPPEKRRIGMVFQDWALFPHLTVAQNVAFGLGRRPDGSRVAEVLGMVGLTHEADRQPGTLSGGQQQRVALARALAPRPEVLLLDEPFSNLDVTLRARLRREVHALLRAAQVTTVFVTHDQDEAFVLGDQVAVMRDGCIEQAAGPAELYVSPATRWVASFVGDANLLAGTATGDRARTALGEIALSRPAAGDVTVLVRPEDLRVERTTAGTPNGRAAATACVTFVEYYGHDAMVSVMHPDAGDLRVRAVGTDVVPGDTVDVCLVGRPTVAFTR
jgi:iron(III) transport system ATP-binding protein